MTPSVQLMVTLGGMDATRLCPLLVCDLRLTSMEFTFIVTGICSKRLSGVLTFELHEFATTKINKIHNLENDIH